MISGIPIQMEAVMQQFTSISAGNPVVIVIFITFIATIVAASTKQNIPEEDPVEKKEKHVKQFRPPLKSLVQPAYLWGQFHAFFKDPVERILSHFVGAFFIINYRHEWGRYRKYDVRIYEQRKKKPGKDYNQNQNKHSFWTKLLMYFGCSSNGVGPHETKSCMQMKKDKHHGEMINLDHNHKDCQLITINISGLKFVTQVRTLNHFPDSLLGNEASRAPFYDPDTQEYFFDRHRLSFEGIMYFYQSGGILRRPYGVPLEIFHIELTFFQMKEALAKSKKVDIEAPLHLPKNLLTKKIWLLFEYPESSAQARIVAIISITAVAISIFTFCAITLPKLSYTASDNVLAIKKTEDEDIFDNQVEPFFLLDSMCICWFVFEFAMRILSCPKLKDFFTDFMNIVDIVAIVPYILSLITNETSDAHDDLPTSSDDFEHDGRTRIETVLKVTRLVRVFKLSRHSAGLKVLGSTLKASVKELSLLIMFLLIGVVFFSSIIYFAEEFEPSTSFKSIPDGFWWAIVTMTTVGYGDVVPVGIYGKIVGSCCTLVGVLTLALPVPIVGSNFELFYHARSSVKKKVAYTYIENCPNRSKDYTLEAFAEAEKLGVADSSSDSDFGEIKYSTQVKTENETTPQPVLSPINHVK